MKRIHLELKINRELQGRRQERGVGEGGGGGRRGPGMPVTVNNIMQPTSVRLEQSNLHHLELTSSLQLFCRLTFTNNCVDVDTANP